MQPVINETMQQDQKIFKKCKYKKYFLIFKKSFDFNVMKTLK